MNKLGGLQRIKNLFNFADDELQRLDNCSALSEGDLLGIAKDDTDFNSAAHLHFTCWSRCTEWKSNQFCALYYLNIARQGEIPGRKTPRLGQGKSCAADSRSGRVGGSGGDWDIPVFISVIEGRENGKGIAPCLVRLRILDDCLIPFGYVSDVASAVISVSVGVTEDGVVDASAVSGVGLEAQLPEGLFQGGSEIVAGIPDQKGDDIGDSPTDMSIEGIVKAIRLLYEPADEGIRIVVDESLENQIQGLAVSLCSDELQSWAKKFKHVVYFDYERETTKDAEDTERPRNTHSDTGRVRGELGQGGEAGERITASPPEQGLTRTSPARRLGGCTARHTHSGSLEDA